MPVALESSPEEFPFPRTEIDTPCLLLDLDLLEVNLQKMQRFVTSAGRKLRPHAKTHKCSALARLQLEHGAIGVCAAKLSEAEALVRAGIQDILITGPVVAPRKIEKLAKLVAEAPALLVVVDNLEGASRLNEALAEWGVEMGVLLDLNVGLGRTGADLRQAPQLVECIHACSQLQLRGIQAYAGHLQHVQSHQERKAASLTCLAPVAEFFRELRDRTASCDIFTTSGTGTVSFDLEIEEITEVQPGSYVCMDEEYGLIGSAENPDRFLDYAPALRIATGVVSSNQKDFITVDAGLKAIYRDGAIPRVWTEAFSSATYDWFGDEYGRLSFLPGSNLPAADEILELVASHCDPTINLYDQYHLLRGDEIVGTWPIDLRGCSQ
jgi:D-serine deaminase-like pyridoxal phosphate-dependent protein